jgi:hypothetical protein
VDTHNEKLKFQMEPWMDCRPVVADLHHIDEEPDTDPHQSENSDPDPHQSEKRPDPHLSDADPRSCLKGQ